ncbi:Zinc metalloproteinase nas-4, partial [Trichinella patagoniensis]
LILFALNLIDMLCERIFKSNFSTAFIVIRLVLLHLLLLLPAHHYQTYAIKLTPEDIIRSDEPDYKTSLDVDDFADNFFVEDVDLRKLGFNVPEDPLLKAGKFEGDIAGFAGSKQQSFQRNPTGVAHSAVRDSWHRWRDRSIPYVLSSRYGLYSRKVIAKAMDDFHKKTCLRFVPRDKEKHRDYVYIEPVDGCFSMVGRMGGEQPLSLDAGCMEHGIIIHELMHTAGFFHEQSRTDRDQYIQIIWKNIVPYNEDQFQKYDYRSIDTLGVGYDYGSIMHYGPYAFSRNGQRTIHALKPGGELMGQRRGFSESDLLKLNKLYDCDENWLTNSGSYTSARPRPSTTTTTLPVTTARPVVEVNCDNKRWECYLWKWMNHCTSNPEFMRKNCRKACNWCQGDPDPEVKSTTPPTHCEDLNGHCKKWSETGFCNRVGYLHFMAATCAKSCNKCSSADSATASNDYDDAVNSNTELEDEPVEEQHHRNQNRQQEKPCTDSEGFAKRCNQYANWGMCNDRNAEFMQKVCPKSCNFCKTSILKHSWP